MANKTQMIIGAVVLLLIVIGVIVYMTMGKKKSTEAETQEAPTASIETREAPPVVEIVTFVIPTDATSLNECYAARYPDLRLAFGTNNAGLGGHWTNNGTKEGRDHTCTMSDEQAQCYIDRYPDAKTYAGTDLEKARKHYYETGIKENRDFACPPAKKEIECYLARYPDLQNAFGTNLYKANSHWHSNGKKGGRDYSCP